MKFVGDEAVNLVDEPSFIPSAFSWLNGGELVVSSTDARLSDPSAVANSATFPIIRASDGHILRYIDTQPEVAVDENVQMAVSADSRFLLAPLIRIGTDQLADVGRIDLKSGSIQWLTKTRGVTETAAISVPGGYLIGATIPFSRTGWLEFVPKSGGPAVRLIDGILVDRIQMVADQVVVGGSAASAPFGDFAIWIGAVPTGTDEWHLDQIYSGAGRFPFVEASGESMLLTIIAASPSAANQVVRVPFPPIGS